MSMKTHHDMEKCNGAASKRNIERLKYSINKKHKNSEYRSLNVPSTMAIRRIYQHAEMKIKTFNREY
jgi:hypothetical protein